MDALKAEFKHMTTKILVVICVIIVVMIVLEVEVFVINVVVGKEYLP